MRIEIGLKTLCLTTLMFGCVLETSALWCERKYLTSPRAKESKYADVKSIRYNCMLLDYQFLRVILKYLLPFVSIFLFKPVVKIFNTNVKFFVFSFVILRVIPYIVPEYYKIFVTDTDFRFNVLEKSEFFKDFVYFAFVDVILLGILCIVESMFMESPGGKRQDKFVADSGNINDDIDIEMSSSGNLSDVNFASGSAVISYNECFTDKYILPIIMLFACIVILLLRQNFLSHFDSENKFLLRYDQTIFNKSVEFLSENNVDLFSKRVKYGVSKSTLHTGIKQVGIIHPTIVFSLNNFYYTTPEEALELGPLVHSMLQSKDNLVKFSLDVVRITLFCIILFGVLKVGFNEFVYKSTPAQTSSLFISFSIFLTVDTVLKVFTNTLSRNMSASHDCYALTMGFNIGKTLEKLSKADAKYYTPSYFYKVLYISEPTIGDHLETIKKCVKGKI